jgi:hypothetical protein
MSEWKPIESAPKDGTHFIAYLPEFDGLENAAQVECWFGRNGQLENVYEIVPSGESYWPTHWRPCFEPPEENQ